MDMFVALVAVGCTVSGEPSDSVDFQVRWFRGDSIAEIPCLIALPRFDERTLRV
jgi:hypothetical protein